MEGGASELVKQQADIDAFLASDAKDLNAVTFMALRKVAETGATEYKWESMRALLLRQLSIAINEYKANGSPPVEDEDGESFETRLERVRNTLGAFPQPPFTLQRMAELLTEPTRFYSNLTKFFRSFSKLVCGISGRVTNAPVLADGAPMDEGEDGDRIGDPKANDLAWAQRVDA